MSQIKPTSATQPSRVRPSARRGQVQAARKSRQQKGSEPAQGVYHSRRLATKDIFFLLLPGLASILASLGYGLWLADDAYARFGPVAAAHWPRPWYALALAAMIVFVSLGLYRIRLSLIFVKISRNGVSMRSGFGRARSFTWEDFQGLSSSAVQERFFGLVFPNRYQASLILRSGKSIRLHDSIQNLPELISRLKAHLYPRLFPNLQASLQAGDWLTFGPLAIHTNGVRVARREFSWQQVRQMDVRKGKLMIEFNDRPAIKLPVGGIPNLELVLQLIEQGIP